MPNKMVTLDWVGKHLSDGKDFKPLARQAMAAAIGDVFYVDLATGADSGTGENWDRAYLTVDYAMDQVTAGKNDYIISRGPHDTAIASATTLETIDIDGVHVIGASGNLNPYTPGYAQRRRSTAAELPVVLITADDVEYAGFEVQGKFDSGEAWNPATPKASLQAGAYTGASPGGERVYIHNVSVRDPGYASMTGGLALQNQH